MSGDSGGQRITKPLFQGCVEPTQGRREDLRDHARSFYWLTLRGR